LNKRLVGVALTTGTTMLTTNHQSDTRTTQQNARKGVHGPLASNLSCRSSALFRAREG
jgi:hypothetical protein